MNGQKLALISQAELHITFPYDGPCISVNGVYARLVHKLPHDIDVINGGFGSLVKIALFSECYAAYMPIFPSMVPPATLTPLLL